MTQITKHRSNSQFIHVFLLVENEEKATDLSQVIDDRLSYQCLFLYTLSQAYDKSNTMDVSVAWRSLHTG
jgi:hypothetical protein